MGVLSSQPASSGDVVGGALQWSARGCWFIACGAPLAIGLASGWPLDRTLLYAGLALAALLLVEAHLLPGPLCALLGAPKWRYLALFGVAGLVLLAVSGDPYMQPALLCVPFVHAALAYGTRRAAAVGGLYLGLIPLGLWLGGQRSPEALLTPVVAYAALMVLIEAFVRVSLAQAEARARTDRLAADLARERDEQARLAEENARLAEQARRTATLAERNRLARELHDTIAQGLTALTMQIDAAQRALDRDPARARARLARAHELSRATLEDVRRSVWALADPPVDAARLGAALDTLTSDFAARTAVAARFRESGEVRIDSPVATQLLRIAQEALQNAEKHAEARSVAVELLAGDEEVRLTVRDDGRGFDPELPRAGGGGGFGLLSLRERARLAGGELLVRSAPGEGTCVTITVAQAGAVASGGAADERSDTDPDHR
jgi:signal transduction histidine kinase